MSVIVRGQPTRHEAKRTGRKGERGVCRIKKRIGCYGYRTVGSGSLIKYQIDPKWKSKYCIVTTKEVFKEDFDIKNYRVDFVKPRSRFKEFELHGAVLGGDILLNSCGLAVIPLDSHSSYFRHGLFGGLLRKKCSVLKHRPFEVESFNDENTRNDAFAKDLCCYMVADDASSTSFGVKPHEITRRDSTEQYVVSGVELARDVPLGAAILRRLDSQWSAVGIFSSATDTSSLPIWLSRESISSKSNFWPAGTQDRGREISRVSDQSRNGQHVDQAGEALVTISEGDSVVHTEPSTTTESLQLPSNNSNGTQNRGKEISRVSDQSRNGQHVDQEETPEIVVVNSDQNSKEEPTNGPGSTDGGTLCGDSALPRISSQFKKEERKKEKEDMKKKDEHDWEKEEEERTNKELQDSKKEEEDRKRKEEQDRMNEDEDRKRKEEQDKKKEEDDKKMVQETDGSPGSQYSAILNVTLASDADGWNKTVNGQLLTKLAQDTRVKLVGFVPKYTPQQKEHARTLNIELVDAKEISGYSPVELLAYPPDGLDIDILIIHAYGRDLGRQAQIIRLTKKCKWVHVVHTISEELEKFAERLASRAAVYESEHELQTALCEKADLVIAIGPKVAEAYKSALRFCGKDKNVIDLTPVVTEEFLGVRQMVGSAGGRFRVLISGSTKYFKVKGCDIAAKAIKLMQDSSYLLLFVGQKNDNEAQLTQALLEEGINLNQLTLRTSSGDTEYWHRLLCEVDLLIKPSRTEGFGISGLRAISADLPVLVSGNCGLGMTLKKLPSGKQHVVESDDPQVWADKIKEVRAKNPKVRKFQSEKLRNEYSSRFSWETQCDQLVEMMLKMVPAKSEYQKEAVELEYDTDEAENRVQSMNLNPDNEDGRSSGRRLEDLKPGIHETSLHPIGCDVVDRGVTQNSRLSTMLAMLPLKLYAQLCRMLNVKQDLGFGDFRMLAKKLGFDRDFIRPIEQTTNPTDVILQKWSSSSESTVGNLIELLKGDDLERMDVVAILEDWANESPE